jgi:predicted enzyme related to lactoylglutathione lyase
MAFLLVNAAAQQSAPLDPGAETQIQEFVISVSSIESALPSFRDVLQWQTKHEGAARPTVARAWGLPAKTTVDEVLLGNAASRYGYVRLVKIHGQPQQTIRPMGRWWDTGGMYNLNVLVKDLDQVQAKLTEQGWHAVAMVDSYEYPGDVRGKSQIMIGPEYVVLSFQQRISPPLSGWPEFPGATHVEVGYQIVNDFDAAQKFWSEVVGLTTREPRVRKSDKPVGKNDYGLPHNVIGIEDSRQGGAYPRKGGEQLIGLRQFLTAAGYDFSELAKPPNLGIMTIRLPFKDIDPIVQRARAAKIAFGAEPQIVQMAPYGNVRLAALRAPGSGLWVEIFEPNVRALTRSEVQAVLKRGGKGRWVSFGGGTGGTMAYSPNGKARVAWANGKAEGTWALKGNALCTAWPSMRDGREQCAVYYAVDGRTYQSFQVDGTPDGFNTFD